MKKHVYNIELKKNQYYTGETIEVKLIIRKMKKEEEKEITEYKEKKESSYTSKLYSSNEKWKEEEEEERIEEISTQMIGVCFLNTSYFPKIEKEKEEMIIKLKEENYKIIFKSKIIKILDKEIDLYEDEKKTSFF
jgi:hypothetical protein